MDNVLLEEIKKITDLLEKQLASNKYLERRLAEILTSPFGLRANYALAKSKLLSEDGTYNIRCNERDFLFYLPKAYQDFIQQKILIDETFYEIDLLSKVCARGYAGGEVLDIGANIGNHSVYFAVLGGFSKVVAFEPQGDIRRVLNKNISLNLLSNVIVLPYAVGARNGFADESHASGLNSGAVSVRESNSGKIPLRSIDSLGFTPSLIKIDVEGYELDVIMGGVNTIQRCHPDIWVECFDLNFSKVDELLQSLKYKKLLSLAGSNYLYVYSS